jgi:hypothetical protein
MRSKQDVLDAIKASEHGILNVVDVKPPSLALCLTTIREALYELLERRKQEAEKSEWLLDKVEKDALQDDATGVKNADPIGSDGRRGLRDELTHILNQRSREGMSNTPDYLLAEFIIQCLVAYETTVRKRDDFHGVKL